VSKRTGIWVGVATLFTLLNTFSAGLYLSDRMHGGSHAALAALGVYWVYWLLARAWRQQRPALAPGEERLERLQQSMDAVAIEVERIGEASRYSAKLEAEKKEKTR